MPKNLDSLNLGNAFKSFRDNGKFSSRRLVRKFASLKKRGVKFVHYVRDELEKNFGASTRDVECEEIDGQGQKPGPPVRPKRCLCNKPKDQPRWPSRISAIGSFQHDTFASPRESSAANSANDENLQKQPEATSSLDQTENLAAIVEEESNSIHESKRESEVKSSSINGARALLPERHQPEDGTESPTPERQKSLGEGRKSSIKSQRESFPLVIQPTEPKDETATGMRSLKIEEIEEGFVGTVVPHEGTKELLVKSDDDKVGEVQTTDINAIGEIEESIQYEIVNASGRDLETMERDSRVRRVVRIDHKTLPPDIGEPPSFPAGETNSLEEWRDVPAPVIDEIRRLTRPKRPHKCPKACPCKFTQELIDIYHESRVLSSRAIEISETRDHCSLRMTSSEIDFFKKDTKMCSVMIGETRSRRAEMRELMDMWQESNEKLSSRKKEIRSIAESIEQTEERIEEVKNLLNDWRPEGRMEQLRKTQRAIEKDEQERIEALEDEERTFAKEQIEEIVKKRESRHEDEKIREEKRKNQRKLDMQALENATSLMQKYIDERKLLLIQSNHG